MSASGNNGGPQHGQATGRLPVTPADRLERRMKRQKLPKEHIAKLLGCDVEQLNAYLSPENRQAAAVFAQRATYESSEMEKAVVKLLMRQEITEAASVVKRTAATLFAQAALAMRRAHAIPQLARYMTDRRSVFQPASSSSVSENYLVDGQYANNRKRKRRATVKALADFKTPPRLKPSADLVCPIRIDVDAEGVRYQDTLLINSAVPGNSPEEVAARIAQDERLGDIVKGAIAESIKRQLMAFASFVDSSSESLHPIHLDLFIDGIALRDQFEWDIYNDLNNAESFAATLCTDMNLPAPFEPAIAFSIREQVYAYRRILYSKRWIGNDPLAQRAAGQTQMAVMPRPLGISTLEPLEKTVVRDPSEAVLWQPVLSELGKDELQYLKTKIAAQRRSMTTKKPAAVPPANGAHHNGRNRAMKRSASKTQKRPINPFIVYCQVQKDLVSHPKQRRSAAESRKILGDMWRKCTDEEKEYYAQLCEVENEKRRREHVFELRDRAIAEWEEDEARRVGLLGAGVLDATTETVRELLFLGYMDERHDVDTHWHAAEEQDDDVDDDDLDEEHGEEEDNA